MRTYGSSESGGEKAVFGSSGLSRRTMHGCQLIIHELNPQVSFHDFRVHPEADEKHIVLEFDLVTPWNVKDEQEMELIGSISERLQQENPYVSCRITPDRPFMHVHSEEEEKSAREKGGEAARKAADTAADTEEKQ